jgi:hypothetical protein
MRGLLSLPQLPLLPQIPLLSSPLRPQLASTVFFSKEEVACLMLLQFSL